MPRMGLTSFLLTDLADSVTQSNKMAKYVDGPGGLDYYWGLKAGAQKMIVDAMPYDAAVGVMANMTKAHQRSHNQGGLKRLHDWRLKNLGEGVPAPEGQIAGPKGELIIKLDPTFAIVRKQQHEAYVLWAVKDVRLTKSVAGMGVHLLELGLQHGKYEDWDFYILDVISGKRFGHSAMTKATNKAALLALQTREQQYVNAKSQAA